MSKLTEGLNDFFLMNELRVHYFSPSGPDYIKHIENLLAFADTAGNQIVSFK